MSTHTITLTCTYTRWAPLHPSHPPSGKKGGEMKKKPFFIHRSESNPITQSNNLWFILFWFDGDVALAWRRGWRRVQLCDDDGEHTHTRASGLGDKTGIYGGCRGAFRVSFSLCKCVCVCVSDKVHYGAFLTVSTLLVTQIFAWLSGRKSSWN